MHGSITRIASWASRTLSLLPFDLKVLASLLGLFNEPMFDDKTSSGVYMLSGNLTVYILKNTYMTAEKLKKGQYYKVVLDNIYDN